MTCLPHTRMASDPGGLAGNRSHLAWEAQAQWFRDRGYRILRCPGCGRYTVVVAADGRQVESFTVEYRSRVA